MKFTIILSFALLFNLLLTAQPTQRKTDTLTITLNDLVISSEKNGTFRPLVRVVAVIEAKEIENKAVNNLPDLFRYIQGIDYKTRGSEGVQGDVNLLGGTFDQTMIMINGINVTDPQTGHHSMNIPVEINQIERIEVLQGPGAWSAGTMAYSGAINIITKEVSGNSADVFMSGGSYGYFKGGASAFVKEKIKGWSVEGIYGGAYSRSDGFAENTDFEIGNIYANVRFTGPSKRNTFFIQSGVQNKSYGANSFYTFTYPEQYEKVRTNFSSLQYLHTSGNWQISASVYHRRLYDKFELFRNEAPQWYTGHNYHRNDVYGADFQVGYKIKDGGTLIAGSEIRAENILSNVLGDLTDNWEKVPGEDGAVYTKSKERYTPSLFVKHLIQFEKWRLSTGISASDSFNESDFKGAYGAGIYGGIAAAYNFTPNFEINFWANNSYRNPTFTDLYYKSPSQSGNLNLKPEKAISVQAGLRYFKANTRFYFSWFFRKGSRIIDWVRESGSEQWQASNLTNVNSTGFELSYLKSFQNSIITNAGLSYGYLYVVKSSGDFHSLYATDYLKHKATLSVSHKVTNRISADWNLLYQERAGTYLDLSMIERDYKPFALLNVKLQWKIEKMKIFLDISNLTGKKYFDLGNLTQPGRWIKSGIILNL